MKVLVFGTFDNLHPGHLYFLNEAQKRGELFVSVGLDDTVEKIKGKKPRQGQDERIKTIREEFSEADIRLGDSDDYLKPIEDIKPDLILLGYDQKLPPGVSESDIPCPIERIEAHKPEEFKSSLL
ncbi:MAG: adenylyltransferase/cytidyltransferase family protein [Candidatus Peribacteraceae bacterium]|jgi:FAD synthetase|nr:adenylyltransferase/cytidyltransferase family protein [Candidatus Peribacteraceae bacterium]HCI04339.1 hypothetical protein [Candidatus Peribacteria bacterium]|tara:strand:+ start:11093 stop:11467 length:375 start_codon:yes stop_codon:yes gene_type:complete